MSEERKSCPFCGEDNPLLEQENFLFEEFSPFYVRCWNCGCRTDYYFSAEEAIERWNRRVDNEKREGSGAVPEL